MVNVRKTEKDVYYLHDYIPKDKYSDYDSSKVNISKKILEYKDWDDDAINLFTNDIMEGIAYLSKNVIPKQVKNLALVPVPSSKVNKKTPVLRSIKIIKDWYENGDTKSKYNCDKKIYGYTNLLKRFKDVPTSHLERRATYYEQFNSIKCTKKQLNKDYMTFILIDDITTTSNIMNACENILANNGAIRYYIYRLAIGHTVR